MNIYPASTTSSGGGGGGSIPNPLPVTGTVELGDTTIDNIQDAMEAANDELAGLLNDQLDTLADILLELDAKIEAGDIVGLDPATIAALQSISATILNLPSTYPDTTAHTKLDTVNAHLATLEGYLDGVESLIGTTNSTLTTVDGHVDGLESLIGTTNTALGVVNTHLTALEGYSDGLETLVGTTNTNLGTDTGTPPNSGTGMRGWLRGIYDRLGGSLAVTGPLTDTQLRASAIPVLVSDGSGALTVDGTVAVSNAFALDATLTGGTQTTRITDGTTTASNVAGDAGQNSRIITGARKEVSFSLSGSSQTAAVDVSSYRMASVQFVTNTGTVTFQGSNDGSTWNSVLGTSLTTTSSASGPMLSSNTTNLVQIPLGYRYFRLSLGSGAATGNIEYFSFSPATPLYLNPAVAQNGTWTVQPGNTPNTTPWLVQASYSYSHIANVASTTTVKSGAGVLHNITINSLGTFASTTTVYDSTTGSGTVIAVLDTLVSPRSVLLDVAFTTGLTIVTTGSVGPDLTVSFR